MKKKQQNFQSKILKFPEDPNCCKQAARVIKNGGLIVFPTKGLYGLGADIHNTDAVKKIFDVKKRELDKPILILIKDISQVSVYCKNVPKKIFSLMEKFWPGDITFVLEASDKTPGILNANSGKIGVRVPAHPFPQKLLQELDCPITGTSANISEMEPAENIDELQDKIIEDTDLVIDAGRLGNKEKTPSTIVYACNNEIKVLREGRILIKDIKNYL